MLLSIGMIVKNEEKYLDRCLIAIKPILDNVDSELIIADTGSTDLTAEIAKKYTPFVYSFKWCDDFSKARNSTLERANGAWYMFLDADEILDNTDEIINFFNSGDYKNYNCAKYMLRNFSGIGEKKYLDCSICRLYKVTRNLKFKGKIHEHIDLSGYCKILSQTMFLHYGYYFDNIEDARKKSERNTSLLYKEIEDNGDNQMYRNQLADSYNCENDFDKAIEQCKIGLNLSDKPTVISYLLYANLALAYFSKKDYLNAIDSSLKYFNSKNEFLLSDLDFYYILANSYIVITDYKKAIEYSYKYFDLYNKNKQQNIKTIETSYRALFFSYETFYYSMYGQLINVLSITKDYSTIYQIYLSNKYFIDKISLNNLFGFFYSFIDTLHKLDNIKELVILYNYIIDNSNEEVDTWFIKCLETYMTDYKQSIPKIISAFSNCNSHNKYTDFMKLRDAHLNSKNNFRNELINFINSYNNFDGSYGDIVYYIIENNVNISILKDKISTRDFMLLIDQLINPNFLHSLCNYEISLEDNYDIYMLYLLYSGVLRFAEEEHKKEYLNIYSRYITVSEKYVSMTYAPDMLNEKNIDLLPIDIRFSFFSISANNYKNTFDYNNYIKAIKSAVKSDTCMQNIVSILINDFEENNLTINENKTNLSEFELLAIQIKENINFLILNGNLNEAKSVLNEYITINPNDSDIGIIKHRIDESK